MREKLHKLRENYLKKIGANSSISKEVYFYMIVLGLQKESY